MSLFLRELRNAALIALGILSAGLGLHGFLLPIGFIDGGVTGVSMLVTEVTGLPLSVLLPLLNLPFVALGFRQIGWAFALRSALAIAGLAVALAILHYPDVTEDKVLTAVFGGFFLGAGIGLAMRGGAVLDGTEVAALLVSKRSGMLRVGDVILAFNVLIFLAAALLLGVESAMYSILTYFSAVRTLDFILHGIEEYTAVTIISRSGSEAIRGRIIRELGRGVTVYEARGGATGAEQDVLYCVVTRLEIGKVRAIVRKEDKAAFVTTHPLSEVDGGTLKKGALPH